MEQRGRIVEEEIIKDINLENRVRKYLLQQIIR
jgi:hypothetical protein